MITLWNGGKRLGKVCFSVFSRIYPFKYRTYAVQAQSGSVTRVGRGSQTPSEREMLRELRPMQTTTPAVELAQQLAQQLAVRADTADAAGKCIKAPEVCTQDYNPVCGCDGETYGNQCMANAAKMQVDTVGECTQ